MRYVDRNEEDNRLKRKVFYGLLICLLIGSFVFASCAKQTTTTTTSTQSTTPPPSSATTAAVSQANWWDKFGTPKYGGTLNIRTTSISSGSFDPAAGMGGGGGFATDCWDEPLFGPNWTLNRNTWAYNVGFLPLDYAEGVLAENWEIKDPTTYGIHLRQGIHWQNKTPANGRELTADDVQFNFDRILGTGHGYTVPNPFMAGMMQDIARVVATDKYTFEVELKSPGAMKIYEALGTAVTSPEFIELGGPPSNETAAAGGGPAGGPPAGGPPAGGPPAGDSVTAGGPLTDWHNVVGTGPWILTDFVEGSQMTFSKNPDYWGYDERYPNNKLPYFDTQKILAIPDISTALAALRTGKVDMMTDPLGGMSWQQAASLKQTNPEIQVGKAIRPGAALLLRCDKKPFTDLRVRQALQMAIDNPSIGNNYYGGNSTGEPTGIIAPSMKGWTLPYDQWSDDLKAQYTYNPTGAKQLLAEAGYPNGFDTDVVSFSGEDQTLLTLIQSEFKDIGVNMKINVFDMGTYMNYTSAGKQDQMDYNDGFVGKPDAPSTSLGFLMTGNQQNHTYNDDPKYDGLVNQMLSASTEEEAMKYSTEADLYNLSQHWTINITPTVLITAWGPNIQGFSGELVNSGQLAGFYRARLWSSK